MERNVVHQRHRSRLFKLRNEPADVRSSTGHSGNALSVQRWCRSDVVHHRERKLYVLELRYRALICSESNRHDPLIEMFDTICLGNDHVR